MGIHARFLSPLQRSAICDTVGRLMMTRRCRLQREKHQTTIKARWEKKSSIPSVEMGCLNNFPSQAELRAHQTEGNIPFGTCLFQDAKKQGALLLPVMDRPKQPANLRGELLSQIRFLNEIKGAWRRDQHRHIGFAGVICLSGGVFPAGQTS